MKQIQPDLWETETQSPFPGLKTHAYLLIREDGNILFYNTGHVREIDAMQNLGGVARQYLSHEDELGDTLNTVAERYGSILVAHQAETESFRKYREPDMFFNQRETHLGNLEVIPTPGHSPGSTCYQVRSVHDKTYLFTGDTLFLNRQNEWTAGFIKGVHDESVRPILAESLRLLRELTPDVVFGSAFVGDYGYEEIPQGEWGVIIDNALKRLIEAAHDKS